MIKKMEIQGILKKIGDYTSTLTGKVINFLSSIGMSISDTTAKLISLVIILIGIFAVIKLMEKPIKYAIIALLVFLSVSLIMSLL